MYSLNINGVHLNCFKFEDLIRACHVYFYMALHCNYGRGWMGARMKLTRRNCTHTRGAMINVRRQRVISNFDTKTIRVSSSPATLSYLTRCLGSLYDDAGGRVRNEEKGKERKAGKGGERKLQKDRYARGSEDETEGTGGKDKDSEEEKEKERDRRHEIRYLNSKQTL